MFAANQPNEQPPLASSSDDAVAEGGTEEHRAIRGARDHRQCRVANPVTVEEHERPCERFAREAVPHSDYLFRHAWHLTKHHVDAEDLLQETMLKAYLSFNKFREGSNLKAWLSRIMVNTWVDGYRSAQRRPTEQLSGQITDAQLADHADHSRADLRSAEAEALTSLPGCASLALRTLPEDLRVTIYYADIEGYRNTEIAELLNIPAGTVASRLNRGRILLRERLIDGAEER